MSTKGPSNHYGNSKGGKQSKFHKSIGYKYAIDFNKNSLKKHFKFYGKQMNCSTMEEYAAHAVKFANYVDKENFKSYKDKNNTTYKYDIKNNVLALIDKRGYVITYYKPKKEYDYFKRNRKTR